MLPTLLSDQIQPAWQNLTPEQRTCWHFYALAHPELSATGELRTLYGQQLHYSRNADIATTATEPLLNDPPPTETLPTPIDVVTVVWPLTTRLGSAETARYGVAFVNINVAIPANHAAIVRQGYDRKKTGKGRPPRIRHVKALAPGSIGIKDLTTPSGYFSSTGGWNKFASIKGRTARRRTDKPLGTLRVINLENGKTIRQLLSNPFGTSATDVHRPEHSDGPQEPGLSVIATQFGTRSGYISVTTGGFLTT